jgi:hypothetical protein
LLRQFKSGREPGLFPIVRAVNRSDRSLALRHVSEGRVFGQPPARWRDSAANVIGFDGLCVYT